MRRSGGDGDLPPAGVPRGIRANNPLNIEQGTTWAGLMPRAQMSPAQAAEQRFCVFAGPEWGYRAALKIFATYKLKHGITTVAGLISRWAPPVENDTGAYIRFVCGAAECGPDRRVDLACPVFMPALLQAMTRMENGVQPYAPAVFARALALAAASR